MARFGYGQSKLVAERLLAEVTRVSGLTKLLSVAWDRSAGQSDMERKAGLVKNGPLALLYLQIPQRYS